MMSSTLSAPQQKFSNLRRRLDQLGYRQPLGIESLPLVERLFLDLIHTTESLKKAKLCSGSRVPLDEGSNNTQVEAYKSDNAKLIKENNELHQQLIHVKEESEFTIKELKSNLRKIENEHADLKFLNNQYVHKLRSLEQESNQKTERILQLQEKNFNAVIQTPGGRKKNIPFRRQRMEVDCQVPPAESLNVIGSASVPASDPYIADLLKVADENIARLNDNVKFLKDDKIGLETTISNLRKQVDLRDAEVDRLTRMLEGGRPFDVVALEARSRQSERTMSHLNIQVDYLQQKNRELQDQLDRLTSQAQSFSEVENRNFELGKELEDVDLMAQKLQREKDNVILVADMEIAQIRAELEQSRNNLEKVTREIAQLKNEKEQCIAELENIKKELSIERHENERLAELVQKVQEDKRRLEQRVNKLTVTEHGLVLEVDQLRHQHKNRLPDRSSKTSSGAVDALIKTLEEERNYYRSEVDVLQQMCASESLISRTHPRSPKNSEHIFSPSREKTTRSTSPLLLTDEKKHESTIQSLENELDYFKHECDRLRTLQSSVTVHPTSSKKDSHAVNEIAELQKERDNLQKMLDRFERHIAEIQANVKVLTLERDDLSLMLKETKEELARARHDAVRSPKSAKTTLAAQAVLRRVENERDVAVMSCRNLTVERDSLRERLKIATDSSLAERAKLEQTIEDLESALSEVESSWKAAKEQLKCSEAHAELQEGRLKDNAASAAAAQEEAIQLRITASQMKLLAEQSECSLREAQRQLSRKDAELRASAEGVQALIDQLNVLSQASQSERDEIARLRSAVAQLDQQKDELQIIVDEKTEQEVRKTDAFAAKETLVTDLQATVAEMESVISKLKDTVISKGHEITNLRRQLDSTSEELTEAVRSREVTLRENRRLQDDLAIMTRENQNVNQDLVEALQEKKLLKEQAQEYIVEVKRCEELLSLKENEKVDIIDQYRLLSQEAERFEAQTHHLESEGSNLKLEILTKDSEIRRMRDRLDQANREIQEHVTAEHAYEVQLSNMAKSVATLEEAVKRLEEEKHSQLLDLSAVHELCARLESMKDNLQRQLTAKSLDHEKLQALLDDVKHESDLLRLQVTNERSTKQGLENLLQENRKKEWQVELAIQEKDAEIQMLQDQLQINASKLECQARELGQHRTHTIEIESDLERLKRQLISEQFEREKVVQELRRNGLSLPGERSCLGVINPNSSSAIDQTNSSLLAAKSSAEKI